MAGFGCRPRTVRTFVYLEDEIAGVVDQAPSAQPAFAWIHGDQLGTPLAATNALSGSPAKVVWRATYAPFGLATPNEDPDGDGQTFALDMRFPGQVRDGESGLHGNFYRTYDPQAGRYLTSDPIGPRGGLNLYSYAEGNPLRFTDPLGLSVTNNTDHTIWIKPEDLGVPLPVYPGTTWDGYQDGIGDPEKCGQVYKTGNCINAVIQPNGQIVWSVEGKCAGNNVWLYRYYQIFNGGTILDKPDKYWTGIFDRVRCRPAQCDGMFPVQP